MWQDSSGNIVTVRGRDLPIQEVVDVADSLHGVSEREWLAATALSPVEDGDD